MTETERDREKDRVAERGRQQQLSVRTMSHDLELRLKASYTSTLRPHTVVAEGLIH